LEDDVVDQREAVEEVEGKVGKMSPLVERTVRNPKTGVYVAFPDFWAPNTALYRTDLWDGVEAGLAPDSWDTVLRAAPRLKAAGHPLGIGLAGGIDSNFNAATLLFSHGASLQDEAGQVTLNRPASVEAVKLASEIYRRGMTEEALFFDDFSDNRFLGTGRGSLILDAISAIRAVEKQDAGLAGRIGLAAGPVGPGGRLQSPGPIQAYVIWKFSPQPEVAQRFLVDLAVNYREPFLRSQFYNLPAFPGAVPDLAALLEADPAAQPSGKYRPLADAAEWSTNAGHPGHTNAAVAEVTNQFLLSKMFAAAARGEKTPEEAVADAEAEIKPIFEKWRERGKI
jgi:multiple sugar transport system substrate-binding protein